MRVCAIILDYRGAAKTLACLRSLIGQGLETAIIVDNSANTDISQELAAGVARIRDEGAGFAIHVIVAAVNLGFAKGVNFALRSDLDNARPHDAYLLLNNDAQAMPGLVSQLVSALEAGADLVAPTVVSETGEKQGVMWYCRYFGLQSGRRLPLSFPFLSGCCLLLRRDVLSEGYLFDESFFMYGEDAYLGWQLHLREKTVCCLDKATVQHVLRGSSTRGGFFYEYHMVRAHFLLSLKTWHNPIEIPFMLMGKLITLTGRALIRGIRYRSLVPVVALMIGVFPFAIRKP